MDIALALDSLVPGADYRGSLTNNTAEAYDNIFWQDSRPKPAWQTIIEAWDQIELDLAKEDKKTECRNYAERLYKLGFSYAGHHFSASRDDVSEIAGMRQVADSQLTWRPVKWPIVGGGFYTISTAADMVAFSEAFLTYRLETHNNDAHHQEMIDDLDVVDAVKQYSFSVGWPS